MAFFGARFASPPPQVVPVSVATVRSVTPPARTNSCAAIATAVRSYTPPAKNISHANMAPTAGLGGKPSPTQRNAVSAEANSSPVTTPHMRQTGCGHAQQSLALRLQQSSNPAPSPFAKHTVQPVRKDSVAAPDAYDVETLISRVEREGCANWAALLSQLMDHLKSLPEAHALACLARAHAARGNNDEAVKAAKQALAIDCDVPLAHGPSMLLARSHVDAGDWASVALHCKSALRARPEDVEASALLGRAQANIASGKQTDEHHTGSQILKSVSSTDDATQSAIGSGELTEGQEVQVFSKSSSKWIQGNVVYLDADVVKVRYRARDKECEKMLPRSSSFLRAAQTPRSHGQAEQPPVQKDARVAHRVRKDAEHPPAAPSFGKYVGKKAVSELETWGNPHPHNCQSPKQFPRRSGVFARGGSGDTPQQPCRSQTPPTVSRMAATSRQMVGLRKKASSRQSANTNQVSEETDPSANNAAQQSATAGSKSADFGEISMVDAGGGAQFSSPSFATIPSTIDALLNYEDLSFGPVLGAGSFGSVYRGTYDGQQVAIKKLHASDGNLTIGQLDLFHKEVANLMAVRHRCLTKFIGAAFSAPHLCIVTEFMPNGSLHAWLHENDKPLVIAQMLAIAIQSTEGVKFLHDQVPPFVHRDLKSANVVLDMQLNAKLCDFGLSQTMENTHISRRANEVGSPRYMAPELFDSHGRLTEKIDVWALGCLILEIFSRRLPHADCTTVQQVMAKLLIKGQLPFQGCTWTAVSSTIRIVVQDCFEFHPRMRIDAARLLDRLRELDVPGAPPRGPLLLPFHGPPNTTSFFHC